MTIGDGIFWSTVLILFSAAIYQVSARKKWRLVGKTLGLLLVVGALGGAATWGWSNYNNRPSPASEVGGVRLGMSPVEVKLVKGAPTAERQAPSDKPDEKIKLSWQFSSGDESTVVMFSGTTDDLKATIVCERGGYATLLGLGRFSSEDAITKKLGQPTAESISKDGLSKFISFKPWKVAYELTKGQTSEVCVSESGSVKYIDEYQPKGAPGK